jgi:hypothetical protein
MPVPHRHPRLHRTTRPGTPASQDGCDRVAPQQLRDGGDFTLGGRRVGPEAQDALRGWDERAPRGEEEEEEEEEEELTHG